MMGARGGLSTRAYLGEQSHWRTSRQWHPTHNFDLGRVLDTDGVHRIHLAAVRVLCEGMVELGILKGSVDEIVSKEMYKPYYMHGTSHWLGLDVHDVGAYVARPEGKGEAMPRHLEPGMAYTVEPGLYFGADNGDVPAAFRGIGIRIEDDVVITEDGVLNLNAAIPKEPEDIEAWVLASD